MADQAGFRILRIPRRFRFFAVSVVRNGEELQRRKYDWRFLPCRLEESEGEA